jgi:D-threo-aldose 1-dehydrogenase
LFNPEAIQMKLPQIIFGTSGLGNLYVALSQDVKQAIVSECLKHSSSPAVFDTAGKYGAGLALESLGQCLRTLKVAPGEVLISNKLGWLRSELKTDEPTFEPGVWKNLTHDAIQKISYDGILECYEQGNELLAGYSAKLVSVHDPDEYLAASADQADWQRRYQDILGAYKALHELKLAGKVNSVGVGAKDWRIIEKISQDVQLDWVMIANSMTIHSHPRELVLFMEKLEEQGVLIINSAIFNAGFLTGSDYYNYRRVSRENQPELYHWRDEFYQLCDTYSLLPAAVCTAFVLRAPGVQSIALNTTNPDRVRLNMTLKDALVPSVFWQEMKEKKLIDLNYDI